MSHKHIQAVKEVYYCLKAAYLGNVTLAATSAGQSIQLKTAHMTSQHGDPENSKCISFVPKFSEYSFWAQVFHLSKPQVIQFLKKNCIFQYILLHDLLPASLNKLVSILRLIHWNSDYTKELITNLFVERSICLFLEQQEYARILNMSVKALPSGGFVMKKL